MLPFHLCDGFLQNEVSRQKLCGFIRFHVRSPFIALEKNNSDAVTGPDIARAYLVDTQILESLRSVRLSAPIES
jgi:hypothetical protein